MIEEHPTEPVTAGALEAEYNKASGRVIVHLIAEDLGEEATHASKKPSKSLPFGGRRIEEETTNSSHCISLSFSVFFMKKCNGLLSSLFELSSQHEIPVIIKNHFDCYD